MSKANRCLIWAVNLGYKVINNKVYSPFTTDRPLKTTVNSAGYSVFSIRFEGKTSISVHRMVAYQKYGHKLFMDGIEVRHIDNNPLNNNEDNIIIGTHSENMMDMPSKDRREKAINASSRIRKFSNKELKDIKLFHNKVHSYKKVMNKFNISSKGTLYYILNNTYVTEKYKSSLVE